MTEPGYINRIRLMFPVANVNQSGETSAAEKRLAVIFPVRPPLEKKLRLDLTRVKAAGGRSDMTEES